LRRAFRHDCPLFTYAVYRGSSLPAIGLCHIMKRLGLLLLLAVLAPTVASAQGPDPLSRALQTLPGEVVFLRSTGPWEREGRTGSARILLVRASPRDETARLFLQWIAPDQRGRPGVIVQEEIGEVFDWRLRMDDYRIEREAHGTRVVFDATVLTNNQLRRYELRIGGPGDFKFEPLQ